MRSDKLKSLKIISENYQYLFTLRPSTQIFIKRVNKKLLRDEKLTKSMLKSPFIARSRKEHG